MHYEDERAGRCVRFSRAKSAEASSSGPARAKRGPSRLGSDGFEAARAMNFGRKRAHAETVVLGSGPASPVMPRALRPTRARDPGCG